MAYAAEHMSRRNWHSFFADESQLFLTGHCVQCGELFQASVKGQSVGQWIDRLKRGYRGCVALPAPAVSAPNDASSLPIPSCRHTIWMGAGPDNFECLKCGEMYR